MGAVTMKLHHRHFPRTTAPPPSAAPPPTFFRQLHDQQQQPTNNPSSSSSSSSSSLKSFIRPSPAAPPPSDDSTNNNNKQYSLIAANQPGGGTRWNPTQEQIGILEMLYKSGMRTPNAPQIEQITSQLGRYGKIEGKNVFYWFQNHKARERQKLKRSSAAAGEEMAMVTAASSPCKRKCRSWGIQRWEENDEKVAAEEEGCAGAGGGGGGDRTLELFPLHPEGGRLLSSLS